MLELEAQPGRSMSESEARPRLQAVELVVEELQRQMHQEMIPRLAGFEQRSEEVKQAIRQLTGDSTSHLDVKVLQERVKVRGQHRNGRMNLHIYK